MCSNRQVLCCHWLHARRLFTYRTLQTMKLTRYPLFICLSIVFQASGGLFGKLAAQTSTSFSVSSVLSNNYYLIALVFMLLQVLVWLQALKHYPLSFAYPFMSLVNFLVLFISAFYFREQVTIFNIVGLSIISYGIFLLSQSDEKT
jgi:multidrug transporter EmrE-like cation transporter